tara:strand:+ start:2906 stop:4678 length:1773 start_codon:yes stop_codon:yes gene_type:complete
MATSANSYLQVTELDFEQIRTNLKSYLSTQSQFQDYDFEGSAMAVLLDVLSYNTHYNAYYVNMLANEMFLDTAQQRDSVVSHAKLVGYTPVSAIGASANVSVAFTGVANTTAQFTIPKNSKFTTTIDDIQYTYVAPVAYTVTNSSNTFSRAITIKEGLPLTHRFAVNDATPQRFVLPNENVDISSISVKVQESVADTTVTEFVRATNVVELVSTTPVYFIEEAYDLKYEIIFGSGSLGKSLKNGNIVIIDYLVCNGDATNGATTFSIDDLTGITEPYATATIATNTNATGGNPAETIDSIKFNAPRFYQTQNRAVVDNDYRRILLAENSDLQSVIAFGGELASPPVYGKVYVAVKPFGEQFVTANRKQQLRESILNRVPLAIDPVFIDPDYTYLIPSITTFYNASQTVVSTGQIETQVLTSVRDFSTNNLERFGNRLRYSRFVRVLDNTQNGSILNNDAAINIQKRFVPNTNLAERVTLNFNNPLRVMTITSTQFTLNGFQASLDDDGKGNIRIYRFNERKEKVFINATAGTVDYTNGIVVLNAFRPSAYTGIEMKVTVTPDRLDIIPIREQILIMDVNDASVTLVGETN